MTDEEQQAAYITRLTAALERQLPRGRNWKLRLPLPANALDIWLERTYVSMAGVCAESARQTSLTSPDHLVYASMLGIGFSGAASLPVGVAPS